MGFYYRPLHHVIVKSMYGIFGLDPGPYHIFNALFLGIYGVLVYGFHLYMCPEKKVNAYIQVCSEP